MHLSTENASAQVGLLIGNRNVTRVEPEHQIADVEMDDWVEARKHLSDAAETWFTERRSEIEPFFRSTVEARIRN
jgi:hypothetical protein